MSSLSSLTVAELKEQLAEQGLTKTGRKADLVVRLVAVGGRWRGRRCQPF